MAARQKVVILGVDGADHALYRRWMDAGLVPNMARLAERGRMGILESTYPPVTAPAWVSMMTGESPGSHGIVGWAAPATNGEYTRKVVNSGSVSSPLLWEIAGKQGSPCIAVNVPVTYPVRPMNGHLVTGMPTPSGVSFTHPPEFQEELLAMQPNYEIDLAWQDYKHQGHELVDRQREMTRVRAELCLQLMREKPWELFMVVFTGSDRLQHCLFSHVEKIDDEEAVTKDTLTAKVRDYFVALDGHLGDLMEAAGEDANFVVVSDHGFGKLDSAMYFSRWLADEGLLKLKTGGSGSSLKSWKKVLNAVGIKRSTLTGIGRSLGMQKNLEARVQKLNPYVGGIEWSQTKVHYYPTNGFFVNLKGRDMFGTVEPGAEYEAVRDDLIRRLKELRNPDTGEPLLPVVKKREEVFSGPNVELLPDVFVEFLDQPFEAFVYDYDVPSPFVKPDWADGTHRRNGLFISGGPAFASGETVEGLEIFDVAPNVLHVMGYPIPDHMDGRFRPDLFAEGDGEGARFEKFDDGGDRFGISEDEERDLEEKLRGLGYL